MGANKSGNNGLLWLAAGVGAGWAAKHLLLKRRETVIAGRVVLITGGSRGLGFLLAKAFAKEHCQIAICARDEDELRRAEAALKLDGANVFAVPGDVTSRAEAERMVKEVTQHFGRIDILVNNAGIIMVGPAQSMTHRDFHEAMDTNFFGVLNVTLAALPQMRDRKSGRIVNITSLGGRVSVPHLLPYSCSKFAAQGLSEGLRAELARDNITVTSILPGTLRTGSHENAYVKGNQKAEYVNFSLSATLPLISMSAEAAAAQIVQATKRGEAERVLSLPAQMLSALHNTFPGVTVDLFGVFNTHVLPSPDGGTGLLTRGVNVRKALNSPLLNGILTLGRKAAERLNEYPGPVHESHNGHSQDAEITA